MDPKDLQLTPEQMGEAQEGRKTLRWAYDLYEPLRETLLHTVQEPMDVHALERGEISALVVLLEEMRDLASTVREIIDAAREDRPVRTSGAPVLIDSEEHPVLQKIVGRRMEADQIEAEVRRRLMTVSDGIRCTCPEWWFPPDRREILRSLPHGYGGALMHHKDCEKTKTGKDDAR